MAGRDRTATTPHPARHPHTKRERMTMMRLYRRPAFGALALGLAAALLGPASAADARPTGSDPGGDERTYLVTVENLTAGQPFTPPVAATHHRRADVFTVGAPASAGVQAVAENGDVPALVAELAGSSRVDQVVVGDADGPVLPGHSTSFEITASPGHRRLSLASMLICSNDGFTGLDTARLPRRSGHSVEYLLAGYDAGTEINTEDFDDLVPPCGPPDRRGLGRCRHRCNQPRPRRERHHHPPRRHHRQHRPTHRGPRLRQPGRQGDDPAHRRDGPLLGPRGELDHGPALRTPHRS